jgi:hypothetical protein
MSINLNVFAIGQFAAMAASLGWLAWATTRPGAHFASAASVCALLAITAIQPFGVRVQAASVAPGNASPVAPDGSHSAGPFRFQISAQDRVTSDIDPDQETIRVTSSIWGPFLYAQNKVADACGNLSDPPCWHENRPQSSERILGRSGDDYWLTLRDRARLNTHQAFSWKLSPGVVYWPGGLYWLAVIGLVGLGIWRRRRPS